MMETVDAHPLTPRQVQQAEADGALVVDVRTDLQFDDAHIPRAICITARRAGFGSRLAWLADPEQPLVLVGRDDEDAREAAELAGAVGLRNIGGFLAGGMTSWREDRLDVDGVERLTRHRAARSLGGRRRRAAAARRSRAGRSGTPATSRGPYIGRTTTFAALPDELDADGSVAVICASGQRAAVGASLLQRFGARDVIHVVDGGVPRWEREGWPVER